MESRGIRKFFRIECKTPICSQISIVKVNNKMVTSGTGNICVENISSGGLKFLYSLNLPVSDTMVIEFKVITEEATTSFYGNIVRKEEIDSGLYRYGVQFVNKADENHEQFIQRLGELNKEGVLDSLVLCSCDGVDCIKKYTGKFNKRLYKRYKLNNFVAKMKVYKISNKSSNWQWVTILIDNISQGGIQFITDIEVAMDEESILEFSIVISDIKIYAKGSALWRAKTEEDKYRYGVKLIIPDSEKERVAHILEQVVDISLEKGLLVHECFRLKFNYSKPEIHNFDWRV